LYRINKKQYRLLCFVSKGINFQKYPKDVETVKKHKGYFCSIGEALTISVVELVETTVIELFPTLDISMLRCFDRLSNHKLSNHRLNDHVSPAELFGG